MVGHPDSPFFGDPAIGVADDIVVVPNPSFFIMISALPTWAALILLGVLIGLTLRTRSSRTEASP